MTRKVIQVAVSAGRLESFSVISVKLSKTNQQYPGQMP
jgi:hypothetical protein